MARMEKDEIRAWCHGVIGMAIFSASLPATRAAVVAVDPWLVTSGRAALAALLAAVTLIVIRPVTPVGREWRDLCVVAFGIVIGFPLFTALALVYVPSSHAIPFIGMLPLATAGFAVWLGGERAGSLFWCCAALGSAAVVSHGVWLADMQFEPADLLMVLAILACGLGYAEGGRLARRLGSLPVIAWALILSLPLSAPVSLALAWLTRDQWVLAPLSAWAGLLYVAIFSMFVGFLFWYRGLGLGGAARIGQLQLLQPFLALALAGALLGESVAPLTWLVAGAVLGLVYLGRRAG
jgi:drug/metabolite transporter (DMT)-like permease